ncbi:MAG: 50S ribosomal protein L21 [Victivallales bacterium]|nr:50S ribosomal protein L21 [Victivallales bacterium]MCF7889002.1 50S ribosomal protein L21 [Victivallales bacterium]
MYAIIETGGKQYKVNSGDIINIERLEDNEPGKKIEFDKVLAVGEGNDLKVGTPYVNEAKVEAEILEEFRGNKVIAFKMKKRKGYRKTKGHRQNLLKVKISNVTV